MMKKNTIATIFIVGLTTILMLPNLFAQKPYRGGEVYSHEEVLYGKFEMSMKMVKGGGMLSTFFTYKSDSWEDGVYWEEIDIEILGRDNATVLSSNIIIDGVSGPLQHHEKKIDVGYSLADTFYTYTLEWTPEYVAWYIDGVELRRDTGEVVTHLTSPQSYRFNTWISSATGWVGSLERDMLPQHQYVDWIEYHSYEDGEFVFQWRDDFETFNTARWGKANWTFDDNLVDFVPANVTIEDSILVLALTDPNPPGDTDEDTPTSALTESRTETPAHITNSKASNLLEVSFGAPQVGIVRLIDLQGKTITMAEINGENASIYYAGVTPGIYLLNVQTKNHFFTEKVILTP